ncbi:hypothetical protein IU431_06635 [Nocardia otitidiscaviarum]|uniref:hypothetical protein n=1 Tax=Nocardia otitidiscaviarum TaxID=1823 RepID=UPI0011DDB353|nr:hypothetical protein [Nocardia otitidiscaviarum]MBF6483833.1 hypothetical protein [Nocardia otitidiscaviarum]
MTVNDALTYGGDLGFSEFAPFIRRVLVEWAREVALSDPDAFAEMVDIAAEFTDALAPTARALRKAGGFSWAEIAEPLGISRQAAQQRWG